MKVPVFRRYGTANYFASHVYTCSYAHRTAEAAKILDRSVALPKHCMRSINQPIGRRVRTETGCTDYLAFVVDRESDSDGVAGERWELPDFVRLRTPRDGFEVEDLIGSCASTWFLGSLILRDSVRFTSSR